MTDDDLERVRVEMCRRVNEWIEARKAERDAKASGDLDAISRADEEAWQAGLALAVPALGDRVRVRMEREIAPLDNQPSDPATNHRRGLMMQTRFLTDLRPFGRADVTDVFAADALRQLNGEEGHLSRPVDTGPGPKGFDPIDLNLMRRYVLRVIVECARTGKTRKQFLDDALPHAPGYDQLRDWLPRIPSEERALAKKTGKAQRAGRPLSSGQAALWAEIAEIKGDDLRKIFGYVRGLDPEKVLAARRA